MGTAYPNSRQVVSEIEQTFRSMVRKDKRLKSSCLLVNSDRLNVNLNIAEGKTGDIDAHPGQPNHLASVGKLFTAAVISILYERGKLDFNDKISRFLEPGLMDGLHIYRGRDYSNEITVKNLLMQTSGLNDVFFPLWKKMLADETFKPTTREAILWGKQNLKPVAAPGRRHFYTDTNYYLLGFIIEAVTGGRFHEVMHEMIFKPSGMDHAYMHGFSEPLIKSKYPPAGLYKDGISFTSVEGSHQIDYAGGSVIAPLEEYLLFMKDLVNNRIIKGETLSRMLNDDVYMGFPTLGFRYGYSIWKPAAIPLLMPEKYACWGCVGVTGAFMFYHPLTGSHIIGTFNDFAYRGKALRFMFAKVIKRLLKLKGYGGY